VPYRDQVLIFDADDTLWEFNHLFERVIDDYLEWLDHPAHTTGEIRGALLDIEAANAAEHGYGTHVFLRSLRDCFLHLNERPVSDAEQAEIDALARPILEHHVTPSPGVVETLTELGTRHRLLLLTKGATRSSSARSMPRSWRRTSSTCTSSPRRTWRPTESSRVVTTSIR
jgi:putative hydrolase of the HAD superfamily